MKKIINTLLVLAVVLVQLIPSSLVNAATISGKGGTNGTITIDDAIEGFEANKSKETLKVLIKF